MFRPRIFLSAVSEEFRTARQKIADIVHTLGYDAISQDDFPTGHSELREWLQGQIDSCEGLIQIVGFAYGAEPSDIDPNYGRVSYTQFEFFYAFSQKKRTWIIFAEKDYPTDKPIELLDLPREHNHPDPLGYQAERRKLQNNYKTHLKKENLLRHPAKSVKDVELIIYRLRDDLSELRQQWDQWRQSDSDFKAHTGRRLDALSDAAQLTTEKIRVHLLETAEKTYHRELAASEVPTDWRERQRLREDANQAHNARLLRIDDLAASFAEIEGRGSASNVFKEMTRIVSEQGVDEAIAYVATQRPHILESARIRTDAVRQRNRTEFQPLLITAGMHETKGQFADAYALYIEMLAIDKEWARLRNNLAWSLTQWGAIIEPGAGNSKLKEAEKICRETIALNKKNKHLEDWAEAQNNLGNALLNQGIRTDGEAGAELLAKAVTAYRQALTVRTHESLPQDWARTQNNLANALSDQGTRTRGEAGAELLTQAVTAYRQALTVYARESLPQHWAMIQNNLGIALWSQGTRMGGEAGAMLLSQSVTAYRQALTVYTHASLPQDWARTQNNLGNALSDQGIRTSGKAWAELLSQAVTAYRQALTIHTRESLPQHWAASQNNLGNTLWNQGIRTDGKAGAELLSQSVAAYRQALAIRTRESLPQDWARTQNNLGNALSDHGIRTGGEAGVELSAQAVTAYREALTVYTRESLPQDWATTQNNLGAALQEQGTRTGGEAGAKLLSQAVTAYREALTVRTRVSLPQHWAATQNNLGTALFELGKIEKSIDLLMEAKKNIDSSFSFYKESGYGHYDDYFDETLEKIERLLQKLS